MVFEDTFHTRSPTKQPNIFDSTFPHKSKASELLLMVKQMISFSHEFLNMFTVQKAEGPFGLIYFSRLPWAIPA
jgi:hypothetical protein